MTNLLSTAVNGNRQFADKPTCGQFADWSSSSSSKAPTQY